MKLSELNDLADRCIERVVQGEGEPLKQLRAACLPFFLRFRKKCGFYSIPVEEVRESLVDEAISRAFVRYRENDRPFSFYLMNAFRDACRERVRARGRGRISDMVSTCDSKISWALGQHTQPVSPDAQAERKEFIEEVHCILENHPPFSKRLVLDKMRGSTLPEMAELNQVSVNECKRVYQHDIYHIRKEIRDGHSDKPRSGS